MGPFTAYLAGLACGVAAAWAALLVVEHVVVERDWFPAHPGA